MLTAAPRAAEGQEHYLRDDLGCGTVVRAGLEPMTIDHLPEPPVGQTAGGGVGETFPYLVLDTNVVLKQMDLLEHEPSSSSSSENVTEVASQPVYERGSKAAAAAAERRRLNALAGPLSRCIFLQTVVDECKHQNLSIFNRMQTLLSSANRQHIVFANEHHRETYVTDRKDESPNDRNDRAIRVATQWFIKHHGHESDIVLITNDRATRSSPASRAFPPCQFRSMSASTSRIFPNWPIYWLAEQRTRRRSLVTQILASQVAMGRCT